MATSSPSTSVTAQSQPPWWRHSVVYQIYIRSFADGNGDGIGDIAGLRSRLPYLARLDVDAIWINPWYESPLHDGGYDVADYRTIDRRIGTLEEAEALVDDARSMGIRVLVDLVPNHTSSEHAWFKEAVAHGSGSPARKRYHFLSGKGPEGALPPNDWQSLFGGPAWTRVPDGEWYLHMFDASQPDLNWSNAEVRTEFESILRFWLDRGFAGFRVDVAPALTKDPTFRDGAEDVEAYRDFGNHPFWDRDDVHEIVRSWRSVLDEYDDRMMVAEAVVPSERLTLYLRPDEYHQVFNFPFQKAGWNAEAIRQTISATTELPPGGGAIPAWVLSNHDVVRHTTRFGLPHDIVASRWLLDGPHEALDDAAGQRRARAAALLMLALPGPVYLYQGEELGLPEVWHLDEGELTDPIWHRSGFVEKGRDGCRVPLPWTNGGSSFGFGSAAAWLGQPPYFADLSVEAQDGRPGSMLELHRRALQLRRRYCIDDEEMDLLDLGNEVVAFSRPSGLTCITNMGAGPVPVPPGELILASGSFDGTELEPDTAIWLLTARPA